ncbi:trp operon leader peptide [Streptomyces sp. NPDC101213]|uniref:trp operon leader peptide n=1 Tax=Streptomyces sp. NPDC101213 TaxID=3366130 RepID=UPI0038214A03
MRRLRAPAHRAGGRNLTAPPPRGARPVARGGAARVASCSVQPVFALSTQNWWWTAHPAAH